MSCMKIRLELNEENLKVLVINYFSSVLNIPLNEDRVLIQVKSKQNYRAEWEPAAFRAVYEE